MLLTAISFLLGGARFYLLRQIAIIQAAYRLDNRGIVVYSEPSLDLFHKLTDSETNGQVLLMNTSPVKIFQFKVLAIDLSEEPLTRSLLNKISHFREVRSLRLSRCEFSQSHLGTLHKLGALERIDLDRTQCTDEFVKLIGSFTNLKQLSLAYTKITDESLIHLGQLSKLQSLNLEGTAITNTGLRHLHSLKTLCEVNLYRTHVDAQAVTLLDQALPLAFVHHPVVLGACPLPENCPSSMQSLPSLAVAPTLLTSRSQLP